jgi:signal transduction histidine kinase
MVARFESLAQRKESFFNQEDLNDIMGDTLDLLRPELSAKNITLITDFSPQPLVGRLNRHLLKVALSHLVRNAVEATRPRGKIMVRTMVEKDYAVLTIQDTGRGMPPEVVDKVFVPFYTTKIGGTGLGMVFVRQIVDEHRGIITLDSKVGRGTMVTIRLPHRFVEKAELGGEPGPPPGTQAPPESVGGPQ